LRKRPDKGLLASMTEVPGSDWTQDFDEAGATRAAPRLKGAKWRRVPGVVRHVFTHFPLELAVLITAVPRTTAAPHGMRWAKPCPTSCARSLFTRSTKNAEETMADGGHNDWSIGPVSQRYPDPLVKSLDPRFDKYRLVLASVERLWTGSRWGEGPVWFGDGR